MAQVSLTTLGSAYTQDFNTLASSGTSSTVPAGWAFSESGSNANTTYITGTGSGNAGDTYSYGATGNSDRAFGGLQSANLVPTIGASFTNNTGSTITSLAISYTGEQWRLGATGRTDRLDFQYSTNATSLTTGSWTDVDNLDFNAPNSTGTVGALDGNLAANRTAISFTITGLSIANGATFWIRWNDFDATGADDGLAVDDFSLTPQGIGNLTTLTTLTSSLNPSFTGNNVTFTATVTSGGNPVTLGTVTFSEGATVLAANVLLNASGQATFSTSALAEGSHPITATYNGATGFNTSNGSIVQVVNNMTVVNGNSFCNEGSITLADGDTGGNVGTPGTPYPSNIFVSGLSGTITSITVDVKGLMHGKASDIDLLLVAPTGETFLMMTGVGQSGAFSNTNLTLSDAAASALPQVGSISSGTYRPTSYEPDAKNIFPAPAPAGPYNKPAPQGVATFASVFNGLDPNGTWRLYATDDTTNFVGSIANGWCLNIMTSNICPASGILYVDATAANGGDGLTWGTAFNKLQDALSLACGCTGTKPQIWVADGTYYPDEGIGRTNDDRFSTFQLCNGVALYGGFAGGETQLSQRDISVNIATLSGDLMQNDGANFANNADNAYHVVTGSGTDMTARIDGFTITAGNADFSTNENNKGAGMFIKVGSPCISNCTFSGNSANQDGGGMWIQNSTSVISNSSFMGNRANFGGGIYRTNDFTITLINCVISGNSATNDGGGIFNISVGGSTTLINGTIAGNAAGSNGGGIYNGGLTLTITNTIIWNNQDVSGLGTTNASIFGGNTTITYSLIQAQNPGGTNKDGTDVANDPDFVSPLAPGLNTGGNYRLLSTSPAINMGNNAAVPADNKDVDDDGNTTEPTPDLDRKDRILQTTVDLGAYEQFNCTPPSISNQPGAVTVCENRTTSFTVAATGSGTLSYQWQEDGVNLSNGGVYSNVTTATLNISDVTGLNGKQYQVIITNDNGTPNDTSDDCFTTSAEVILTVLDPQAGTLGATNPVICDGGDLGLTHTGFSGVNNFGTLAFRKSDGSFVAAGSIDGPNSAIEQAIEAAGPGEYCIIASAQATKPGDFETGACGINPDGTTFAFAPLDAFRACLQDQLDKGVCVDWEEFCVTVNPKPDISVSAATSPICAGENAVFNLTGTANVEVTYNINNGGNQTVNLDANGEATVTVNGATTNQTLNLVSVGNTTTNCSQNLTGMATVIVNQPATVTAGTAQTICQTKTVDLVNIGASIGGGATTGVWSTSGDGTFTGGTAFGAATAYVPGANDKKLGLVTLTLTTTDAPEPCPNVADQVQITILKVDCGAFPWSGNN